jgi:hypothetical protein
MSADIRRSEVGVGYRVSEEVIEGSSKAEELVVCI